MFKKLSVLIPVYNEKDTIKQCVESVLKADIGDLDLEILYQIIIPMMVLKKF